MVVIRGLTVYSNGDVIQIKTDTRIVSRVSSQLFGIKELVLDLLDNVEDVGALLPQHAIHCRVVGYDHLENRHSWLTIKLLLSCTNNK